MIKHRLFIVPLITLLLGCQNFVIKKHIVDNYYLVAPDSPEQTCLSYNDNESTGNYATLIDPTVIAAGYDKKFIIIKKNASPFSKENSKLDEYYIIPIIKISDFRINNVVGPLDSNKFESRKLEMGIATNLKFSIFLKDLY